MARQQTQQRAYQQTDYRPCNELCPSYFPSLLGSGCLSGAEFIDGHRNQPCKLRYPPIRNPKRTLAITKLEVLAALLEV